MANARGDTVNQNDSLKRGLIPREDRFTCPMPLGGDGIEVETELNPGQPGYLAELAAKSGFAYREVVDGVEVRVNY